MQVRSVRLEDAAAWVGMRQQLWPAPQGEHAEEIAHYFEGVREDPAATFLVLDHDRPVGFAEVSIRSHAEGCRPGPVAYLEGWFVLPAWRGRGAGAALLRAVEAWGRAQGCRELGSDTESDNEAGAAAHRALGFQEVERVLCFRKDL